MAAQSISCAEPTESQPSRVQSAGDRITQNLSWAEIHRLAGLIGQPRNLAPRFNIAPTTPIEVIRAAAAGNELVPMYWGLVPSWWKKPLADLPSTFNARAETVAERPRAVQRSLLGLLANVNEAF